MKFSVTIYKRIIAGPVLRCFQFAPSRSQREQSHLKLDLRERERSDPPEVQAHFRCSQRTNQSNPTHSGSSRGIQNADPKIWLPAIAGVPLKPLWSERATEALMVRAAISICWRASWCAELAASTCWRASEAAAGCQHLLTAGQSWLPLDGVPVKPLLCWRASEASVCLAWLPLLGCQTFMLITPLVL